MKGTYKGKDITTMTREELIEALNEMGELYRKDLIKLYENVL